MRIAALLSIALGLLLASCAVFRASDLPPNTVDCDPHMEQGVEMPHCEVEADED